MAHLNARGRFVAAFGIAVALLIGGCSPPSNSPPAPFSGSAASEDQGKLTYVQIDVGQGDSELLVSPDGHAMLVDAGLPGNEAKIRRVLDAHGVTSLDYLVESHPHADHIGSMPEVIEQGPPIDLFLASGYRNNSAIQARLLEAVRDHVRNHGRYVRAGDHFKLGDSVTLDVLQPEPPFLHDTDSDPNNNSVVLRVGYGSVHLLLTGDMEEAERARLYARGADLRSDVLKAAHHGSHNGTDADFLSRVHPRYALISCGAGNDYGHPHREALDAFRDAGVKIHRTDLEGDVTLHSDGRSVEITPERTTSVPLTLDGRETAARVGDSTTRELAGTDESPVVRHRTSRRPRSASDSYTFDNGAPSSGAQSGRASSSGGEASESSGGESGGPIIGNRRSKVYHLAGSDRNLPAPENRVYFQSEAEAAAAGYRPARR